MSRSSKILSNQNRSGLRSIKPDPIYNNIIVSKMINCFMTDGKKNSAAKIVYYGIEKNLEDMKSFCEKKVGFPPEDDNQAVDVFFSSMLSDICPSLESRSKRVRGTNMMIPYEVSQHRARTLVFRLLVKSVRSRNEKTTHEKFANEISNYISSGKCESTKERDKILKVADSNRMFANFA